MLARYIHINRYDCSILQEHVWLLLVIAPRTTYSIQFRIFLQKRNPLAETRPPRRYGYPPRGSFSFGAQGGEEGKRVHTRVQSCGSPVRSSVSPAREPGVRSACLQPRIHVGITIAHTFGRDKKVEECPSDPRAYTGCHACTRESESESLRVARARCEMVRAHTHTATCRSVSVYTHIHTHTCTRTHNAPVRTVVARRTPPCQPPVVAVKTKTEIRTSQWEKQREDEGEERGENGRETGKKPNGNRERSGILGRLSN